MIDSLTAFTESLPMWLQWVGIMLAAAIPFIESYFGTAIGVVAGVHPVIAVIAAVVGNTASMLAFVFVASAGRNSVVARRSAGRQDVTVPSPRRQRIKRLFDRFGVPGVSLLGQVALPSQITSGMMVSFGASRNAVIFWQIISITLWGIIFATLATGGVALLR